VRILATPGAYYSRLQNEKDGSNANLDLVYIVTSIVSGYILNHTPFALGYQVIFSIRSQKGRT
jgi:hypothetical protein